MFHTLQICHLFLSPVIGRGQSSAVEKLSEESRMLSSWHSSSPPSPPFSSCFEIIHLLALIPSFTPSPVQSSHFPYTLTIFPSSPSFQLLYFPCPLPPLIYPSFPLTSLPFSLSSFFFLSLLSPPLPSFRKCGCWLAGSCWLASGGGYSFIIPPRLPDRLATMSQELNICLYYLLV